MLTISYALEVEVGLSGLEINTNPFVVNLILDIREENEAANDTSATRRLHTRLDVAVPHVRSGREHGTRAALGHGEQSVVIVEGSLARPDPRGLVRVTKVVVDANNAILGIKLEVNILAGRSRDTGVHGKRVTGVAASQTVGTNTTLAILYSTVSDPTSSKVSKHGTGYLREQQGAFSGHWLPAEHF